MASEARPTRAAKRRASRFLRPTSTGLAAAICSGDVLKAEEAIRAHVRQGYDQIMELFSSFEHRKGWRTRMPEPKPTIPEVFIP